MPPPPAGSASKRPPLKRPSKSNPHFHHDHLSNSSGGAGTPTGAADDEKLSISRQHTATSDDCGAAGASTTNTASNNTSRRSSMIRLPPGTPTRDKSDAVECQEGKEEKGVTATAESPSSPPSQQGNKKPPPSKVPPSSFSPKKKMVPKPKASSSSPLEVDRRVPTPQAQPSSIISGEVAADERQQEEEGTSSPPSHKITTTTPSGGSDGKKPQVPPRKIAPPVKALPISPPKSRDPTPIDQQHGRTEPKGTDESLSQTPNAVEVSERPASGVRSPKSEQKPVEKAPPPPPPAKQVRSQPLAPKAIPPKKKKPESDDRVTTPAGASKEPRAEAVNPKRSRARSSPTSRSNNKNDSDDSFWESDREMQEDATLKKLKKKRRGRKPSPKPINRNEPDSAITSPVSRSPSGSPPQTNRHNQKRKDETDCEVDQHPRSNSSPPRGPRDAAPPRKRSEKERVSISAGSSESTGNEDLQQKQQHSSEPVVTKKPPPPPRTESRWRLVIVRHGERADDSQSASITEEDSAAVEHDPADPPLSKNGRQSLVGELLHGGSPSDSSSSSSVFGFKSTCDGYPKRDEESLVSTKMTVVSSPFKRCLETAEGIIASSTALYQHKEEKDCSSLGSTREGRSDDRTEQQVELLHCTRVVVDSALSEVYGPIRIKKPPPPPVQSNLVKNLSLGVQDEDTSSAQVDPPRPAEFPPRPWDKVERQQLADEPDPRYSTLLTSVIPQWPEKLEVARQRYRESFFRFLRFQSDSMASASANRNKKKKNTVPPPANGKQPSNDEPVVANDELVVLVTHGDAIEAIYSLLYPSRTVYAVDYLGCVGMDIWPGAPGGILVKENDDEGTREEECCLHNISTSGIQWLDEEDEGEKERGGDELAASREKRQSSHVTRVKIPEPKPSPLFLPAPGLSKQLKEDVSKEVNSYHEEQEERRMREEQAAARAGEDAPEPLPASSSPVPTPPPEGASSDEEETQGEQDKDRAGEIALSRLKQGKKLKIKKKEKVELLQIRDRFQQEVMLTDATIKLVNSTDLRQMRGTEFRNVTIKLEDEIAVMKKRLAIYYAKEREIKDLDHQRQVLDKFTAMRTASVRQKEATLALIGESAEMEAVGSMQFLFQTTRWLDRMAEVCNQKVEEEKHVSSQRIDPVIDLAEMLRYDGKRELALEKAQKDFLKVESVMYRLGTLVNDSEEDEIIQKFLEEENTIEQPHTTAYSILTPDERSSFSSSADPKDISRDNSGDRSPVRLRRGASPGEIVEHLEESSRRARSEVNGIKKSWAREKKVLVDELKFQLSIRTELQHHAKRKPAQQEIVVSCVDNNTSDKLEEGKVLSADTAQNNSAGSLARRSSEVRLREALSQTQFSFRKRKVVEKPDWNQDVNVRGPTPLGSATALRSASVNGDGSKKIFLSSPVAVPMRKQESGNRLVSAGSPARTAVGGGPELKKHPFRTKSAQRLFDAYKLQEEQELHRHDDEQAHLPSPIPSSHQDEDDVRREVTTQHSDDETENEKQFSVSFHLPDVTRTETVVLEEENTEDEESEGVRHDTNEKDSTDAASAKKARLAAGRLGSPATTARATTRASNKAENIGISSQSGTTEASDDVNLDRLAKTILSQQDDLKELQASLAQGKRQQQDVVMQFTSINESFKKNRVLKEKELRRCHTEKMELMKTRDDLRRHMIDLQQKKQMGILASSREGGNDLSSRLRSPEPEEPETVTKRKNPVLSRDSQQRLLSPTRSSKCRSQEIQKDTEERAASRGRHSEKRPQVSHVVSPQRRGQPLPHSSSFR